MERRSYVYKKTNPIVYLGTSVKTLLIFICGETVWWGERWYKKNLKIQKLGKFKAEVGRGHQLKKKNRFILAKIIWGVARIKKLWNWKEGEQTAIYREPNQGNKLDLAERTSWNSSWSWLMGATHIRIKTNKKKRAESAI